MRAYRGTLNAFVLVASLAVVGCSSSLPNGSTGTGGSSATGGATGIGAAPQVHRAVETTCPGELPEAGVKRSVFDGNAPGPVGPDGGTLTCAADSDCPPCSNGQMDHCVGGSVTPFHCVCDECNSDQDCGGTAVCACNQIGWADTLVGNLCLSGNCRVDADCGPGGFCSPSPPRCGSGGYYCHTTSDTCLDSTDCAAPGECVYSPAAGAWACTPGSCGGG